MFSVPPQWTELAPPDPEIVIGSARAVARLGDLLELARLVTGLREADTGESGNELEGK